MALTKITVQVDSELVQKAQSVGQTPSQFVQTVCSMFVNGYLVADKEALVLKLHAEGASIRQITKTLGVPRSTIHDWLAVNK